MAVKMPHVNVDLHFAVHVKSGLLFITISFELYPNLSLHRC